MPIQVAAGIGDSEPGHAGAIAKRLLGHGLLVLAACGVFGPPACPALEAGRYDFQTCHARWNDAELSLGNAHVQRVWRIRDGLLTATSFRDLDAGVEWLARPAARPAPYPPNLLPAERRTVTITARGGRSAPVEAESLVVELAALPIPDFPGRPGHHGAIYGGGDGGRSPGDGRPKGRRDRNRH